MATRRSGRLPNVASPLALLAEAEPLHRALVGAMSGLSVGGAHYAAVDRAREALARLAADLGHPGTFDAGVPRRGDP